MLDKLTGLASKALDVGTDLGKSALSTTQDLASRVTETGKEKVREIQDKVSEFQDMSDTYNEVRALCREVVADENASEDRREFARIILSYYNAV